MGIFRKSKRRLSMPPLNAHSENLDRETVALLAVKHKLKGRQQSWGDGQVLPRHEGNERLRAGGGGGQVLLRHEGNECCGPGGRPSDSF